MTVCVCVIMSQCFFGNWGEKKSQKQMQDVKCGTVHTLFLPVCLRVKTFGGRELNLLQQGEKENYNFEQNGWQKQVPQRKNKSESQKWIGEDVHWSLCT